MAPLAVKVTELPEQILLLLALRFKTGVDTKTVVTIGQPPPGKLQLLFGGQKPVPPQESVLKTVNVVVAVTDGIDKVVDVVIVGVVLAEE